MGKNTDIASGIREAVFTPDGAECPEYVARLTVERFSVFVEAWPAAVRSDGVVDATWVTEDGTLFGPVRVACDPEFTMDVRANYDTRIGAEEIEIGCNRDIKVMGEAMLYFHRVARRILGIDDD